MKKQPLLILLVCFILGIFVNDYFVFNILKANLLLIISFLLLVFTFSKFKFFKPLKNIFLGLFFFSLGIFSHFLHSQKPEIPDFEGKQKVVFQLNKKLNSNEKYRRYEVEIFKVENFKNEKILPLNAVISVPKEEKPLDFKEYFQTEVYLNKVKAPENDFQFNYAKYLSRKNIYYQSFATDEILISTKKNLSFAEKIKQKRAEILQNIDESKLSEATQEFLKGIILADRTEMNAEMVSDFSKSGLVHFLAISGTHFAIIFWLILLLLKPIFPPKYRNFPIVISLILIWIFAVFIDFGSSVVRSCLMITVYYTFILLHRKPDLLHSLSIAGFLILISDTHQLFDVGFQLSFLAVLGIFWLNEPILEFLPKPKNKIQNFFVNIISISFSAQIATLPLVIFYFHQYSLLSVIANLVILPFSEIIIIFSLLMTILFAFKIEFFGLNFLYENIVKILLKSIHFFASKDWFFYKNIPINIFEISLIFLAIYYLRFVLKNTNSKAFLRFSFVILLFFLLRISFNFYSSKTSENVLVNYFKSNVFLVKEKDKVICFMDENSNKEKIQKNIIEPFLSSRRIDKFEVKKFPENTDKIILNSKIYDLK